MRNGMIHVRGLDVATLAHAVVAVGVAEELFLPELTPPCGVVELTCAFNPLTLLEVRVLATPAPTVDKGVAPRVRALTG